MSSDAIKEREGERESRQKWARQYERHVIRDHVLAST